ncbi:MAG: hypothetical protein NVS4B3_07740 [Gemmatimonadaceae bacterium]
MALPPAAIAAPDTLSMLMPSVLAATRTPGAAVAIVEHGRVVWARGFGWADRERRIPVTDSTVFQVASISKAVTAWGVLHMVDAGRVELDAPAERYLTRWHLPRSRYDPHLVTVRRILSHTAGLSNNAYEGYRPDTMLPTLVESLSGHNDGVGDVRIVAQPGTRWAYSEGGYTLLQLIVEEVSGEAFADYMHRAVLDPLGMRSSSFRWDSRLRARTAIPYDGRERPLPNYLFVEQAADGLYATAPDLARFVAALMTGFTDEPPGRGVLFPATVALLETPAKATRGAWGLGIATSRTSEDVSVVGHGGSNRGWRAGIVAYPARGTGIVVLTNGDNGGAVADALICAWDRYELSRGNRSCRR